jgi:multidrug resistance efflux pump
MTVTEITSWRSPMDPDQAPGSPVVPELPTVIKARVQPARITPFAITVVTVAVAALLGWAMWDAYMGTPWTRDATVRAYVVTMAPEVAGRIVELPVVDNKYVRKSDLLMVVDPTNYRIAVEQAEAAVRATKIWRKKARAAFRTPSSSLRSCISRKPRFRPHKPTAIWPCDNSKH